MLQQQPGQVGWSSPTIFILAACGSVIGLSNVWKFPSLVASNGGGAFLLLYLLCLAVIGIPLMAAELSMGRCGRGSPIRVMQSLATEAGQCRFWALLGPLTTLAGFLLLSYYSVIAGWSLAFVMHAVGGTFSGRPPQAVGSLFAELVSRPEQLLLWHTLLMTTVVSVLSRGVRPGLEQAMRYAVPALFVLLLVMVGVAVNAPGFKRGLASLFIPDIRLLSLGSVLAAMKYALFTLSAATGVMVVYGAYLPKEVSIIKATLVVAGADTLVSLMVGMAILPMLMARGLEPAAGPQLAFQTLPIIFGQIPHGTLLGLLFFLLLVLAAWTTLISLAEPAVAWLEERMEIPRKKAALWAGIGAWFLGIGTVLSFNLWAGQPYLLFGKSFFHRLDYLVSTLLIPVGGLLLAIFVGWVMHPRSWAAELGNGTLFRLWHFLLRYVVPAAVLIIFVHGLV